MHPHYRHHFLLGPLKNVGLGFILVGIGATAFAAYVEICTVSTDDTVPGNDQSDGTKSRKPKGDGLKGTTIVLAATGVWRFLLSFSTAVAIAADYRALFARYVGDYTSDEYKGGIYVKAGQHLASLVYIIPREFTDTLAVLQDRAPFRHIDEMSAVLHGELGTTDGNNAPFRDFDPVPIAAASIAQVHKAVTWDGETVAVKIQYPDVARLFNVDTWTMQILSDLVQSLFPEFRLGWIVTEFRSNLVQEFDFRHEATQSERTNARFAIASGRGNAVRCPRIRWDLTTKRVLTMEFVDGVKVDDVDSLVKKLGVRPKDVGRLLAEVFAEMIFVHGVLHSDPHAGNILVVRSPASDMKPGSTPLPQLVLLDHGLYRRLSDEFRVLYCRLWRAMVLGDVPQLRSVSAELGVEKYYKYLPLIFTNRPVSSTTPLGSQLSPADRARVRQELKQDATASYILSFFESLPRDMLFALRVGNLVRGTHRALSGDDAPPERFRIFAGYAVKGAYTILTSEREATLNAYLSRHRDSTDDSKDYASLGLSAS
ncbi:hypothetical protein HK102_001835, partial [Quaeritorhiza haematococci]